MLKDSVVKNWFEIVCACDAWKENHCEENFTIFLYLIAMMTLKHVCNRRKTRLRKCVRVFFVSRAFTSKSMKATADRKREKSDCCVRKLCDLSQAALLCERFNFIHNNHVDVRKFRKKDPVVNCCAISATKEKA